MGDAVVPEISYHCVVTIPSSILCVEGQKERGEGRYHVILCRAKRGLRQRVIIQLRRSMGPVFTY